MQNFAWLEQQSQKEESCDMVTENGGPTKDGINRGDDKYRQELLDLIDHIYLLVSWCSVRVDRETDRKTFVRAEAAMWAVAYRVAGNDALADRLIRDNKLLGSRIHRLEQLP